jgi:hypothetical protein
LERCSELLGVDLATVCRAAADVEPYVRADGTKVWSLMQMELRLRPEAYGRVRGGYLAAAASTPPAHEAVGQLGYRNGSPSPNPGRLG